MVYVPGRTLAKRNLPSSFATLFCSDFVALSMRRMVAPAMAAPASSLTEPFTSEEVVCASAAVAPSRSTKMTEANLLMFLTLLVDTPRPTRPPPGRRRPSVCVQRFGFVGGEGTVFVFPEPTPFLKCKLHARAYVRPDVSATRGRRKSARWTRRREIGK